MLKNPFIPFALPDIGPEEEAAVVECLKSGWITTGPKCKQFEQDFAATIAPDVTAIAVNSATAGLHLALEAMGIGPGDRVITTTHTFTATAEVVRYLGADPEFVDISDETYCVDPLAVETSVRDGVRAILPVHYAGFPCDMDSISRIARARGIGVLEDAAHAFPTRYGERLIGALDSDATVFSFYATKTLATGEGGMVVTRSPTLAKRIKTMRLHGIDRDAFDRYTSTRPAWYYEVVAPGFKYNMTDVAAAMGIEQLRKTERFSARRAFLADRYDSAFRDLPLKLPPRPATPSTHAWHLYVLQLEEGAKISRDDFIARMYDHGIGCSVHYIPLHLQPYWRDRYRLRPEQFPVSQRLYERGVSLPLYTKMSDQDQERVISAVRSIVLNS
jgi:dTDP-4-amino-4,6-dideoxygalactose transaminase